MTRVFIVERMSLVGVSAAEMASTHSIGLATTVAGRPVEFMFNWVPRHGYYTMDVVTDEDGLLGHFYPMMGEPIDIPGFTGNPNAPDITILLSNLLEDGDGLSPDNWGKTVFTVSEGTIDRAEL